MINILSHLVVVPRGDFGFELAPSYLQLSICVRGDMMDRVVRLGYLVDAALTANTYLCAHTLVQANVMN